MRSFIGVCWILVCTTQICAQQRCNILHITGTSLRHHVSGRYQILPSSQECSGRQGYKQDGGDLYLYYNSSLTSWIVGSELCANRGYLTVRDTALNPEDITGTWKELDADKNWVLTSQIKVLCATGDFQGCEKVRVENAQWNTLVEGSYQAMVDSPLCYGRYTYKHVSSDLFLYSVLNWYIDSENCDDNSTARYYARFQDGAFYPEDILGTGQEPGKVNNWVTTGLNIQCSGSGTMNGWLGLTIALVFISLGLE